MSKTTFQITFKMTRDNDHKLEDYSWFDPEHIETEIKNWLEDLDYKIPEGIKIQINRGA